MIPRLSIDGMIANDACGQGLCLYDKTSAHVRGLRLAMEDGTDHWSIPVDAVGMTDLTRLGAALCELLRIELDEATLIAQVYPDLKRFMTGYDLARLRDGAGRFNLNSVICESEGTLAMVAEAELNLLPIPTHTALLTVQYAGFHATLTDARLVAGIGVASVETVDEKVLSLAKGDIGWSAIARHFPEGAQRCLPHPVKVLADALAGAANLRHSGGQGHPTPTGV